MVKISQAQTPVGSILCQEWIQTLMMMMIMLMMMMMSSTIGFHNHHFISKDCYYTIPSQPNQHSHNYLTTTP